MGKTNAFRIVDFIGKQNEFSNIGNLIIYLFRKYKSEFIDIYSYGIDIKYMKKLGFKDRRKIRNLNMLKGKRNIGISRKILMRVHC